MKGGVFSCAVLDVLLRANHVFYFVASLYFAEMLILAAVQFSQRRLHLQPLLLFFAADPAAVLAQQEGPHPAAILRMINIEISITTLINTCN